MVDTDAYLLQVIRYVHNNPVKAKMVSNVDDYAWSSYNEYGGKAIWLAGAQRAFVLGMFSDNMAQFRRFH